MNGIVAINKKTLKLTYMIGTHNFHNDIVTVAPIIIKDGKIEENGAYKELNLAKFKERFIEVRLNAEQII